VAAMNNGEMLKAILGEQKQISKKLDDHGKKLDDHGKKLDDHGKKLGEYGNKLDDHGSKLGEYGNKLDEHGNKLGEHGNKLDEHGNKLGEHDKLFRAVINGQSAMKAELLKKIDSVEQRLESKMDVGFAKLTRRLDWRGMQLAELDEEAPTREEFCELAGRVEKLESGSIVSVS
jgi:uncharacterized coiled-coil DUF342 family protein